MPDNSHQRDGKLSHNSSDLFIILPALLVLLMLVIQAKASEWAAVLLYDREQILAGEIWRLFSGHFVHVNWTHTLLNVGSLGLAVAIFRQSIPTALWVRLSIFAPPIISLAFMQLLPDLQQYYGFSGVFYAALTAGAVAALPEKRALGIIILLFMLVKLTLEALYGAQNWALGSAGDNILTQAHLYGAITGLIIGTLFLLKRWLLTQMQPTQQ